MDGCGGGCGSGLCGQWGGGKQSGEGEQVKGGYGGFGQVVGCISIMGGVLMGCGDVVMIGW